VVTSPPPATHPAAEWWRPQPANPQSAHAAAEESIGEGAESSLPFWGLLILTFILLIAPQVIVPGLAAFRIALMAAVATALALLADRVLRGQPLSAMPFEFKIAMGLVVWSIATVPFSFWPGGSLAFLLDFYAKSLVLFWLLANVVSTPGRMRRLAWTLVVLSLPIAVTGIQNFSAGVFVKGTRVQRIVGYDAPLTHNPNDLALMLNLLIPIVVALLLTRPRPVLRVVLLLALVLNVGAVIVTFSRAGFLTLAAIALAYGWKLRRRAERRWALLAVTLAVACLPLVPTGYLDRLASTIRTEADRTGSTQARWADTWVALHFVAEHPIIGAGLGQDVLALNRERGPRWTAVHNVYLQHAVDLGLPGLALCLMLLRACVKAAGRAERRLAAHPAAAGVSPLAGGIQISLIGFAVGALFHPVAYHFYFYYIAGMAVALKALAAPRETPGASRHSDMLRGA
jgi:O-antigen ligase